MTIKRRHQLCAGVAGPALGAVDGISLTAGRECLVRLELPRTQAVETEPGPLLDEDDLVTVSAVIVGEKTSTNQAIYRYSRFTDGSKLVLRH